VPKKSEFPGLKIVRNRKSDGTVETYVYHRATGHRIDHAYGSPAFIREYRELQSGISAAVQRGTLEDVVNRYRKDSRFTRLKPRTRYEYDRYLEPFLLVMGRLPIRSIRRKHILAFLDEQWGERAASRNRCLATIQAVFRYAQDYEFVEVSVAHAIRKDAEGEPYRAWEPYEIEKFRDRWPLGTRERLAFELFYGTIQRHGDVRDMTYADLDYDGIRKTKSEAFPAIETDVVEAVNAWIETRTALAIESNKDAPRKAPIPLRPPKTEHLLMSLNLRQPLGPSGLTHLMTEAIRLAGLPNDLVAYALRHTAITEMRDEGASFEDIAGVTGHKDTRTVARYAKTSDRRNAAARALAVRKKVR
jgi:integrase